MKFGGCPDGRLSHQDRRRRPPRLRTRATRSSNVVVLLHRLDRSIGEPTLGRRSAENPEFATAVRAVDRLLPDRQADEHEHDGHHRDERDIPHSFPSFIAWQRRSSECQGQCRPVFAIKSAGVDERGTFHDGLVLVGAARPKGFN